MSNLYVVATPIGNLEDVTARSRRVLSEVQLIVAEDTRIARRLLSSKGVEARVLSYNEHNRGQRIPQVLKDLEAGDVALVCDAGTPCISDPGAELVAAARAAGHQAVSVPGPSALSAALSISGFSLKAFAFVGFLPRQAGQMRSLLVSFQDRTESLVGFESPARLRKSLQQIAELLPQRRLAICREMTKLHEEVFSGRAADALAHFQEPRGEFVLVIEGAEQEGGNASDSRAAAEDAKLMWSLGLTGKQSLKLLMQRHSLSRKEAYAIWLESDQPA